MSRRAKAFAEADLRSDAIIRSPSRAARLRSSPFYQISTRDTSRLPQIAFAKRHSSEPEARSREGHSFNRKMTDTVFSYKYQLTQEIPAAIMNARLNVLDIGATDGRNGSAEDSRGRVTADDGGRGCGLCRQQYVADSTAGRSHQHCLQLSEVAGGPGGASSAGAAETSRANSEVGYRGIHHLSRGRHEAEDAETASAVDLQYDARRIPDEMGAGTRLPDSGAKLCPTALRVCQKNRIGTGYWAPSSASKGLRTRPKSLGLNPKWLIRLTPGIALLDPKPAPRATLR